MKVSKVKILNDTIGVIQFGKQRLKGIIIECPSCKEPNTIRYRDYKKGAIGLHNKCSNKTTHGETGSPLYLVWQGVKSRCNNPQQASYVKLNLRYCSEWAEWEVFKVWAIKSGYKKGLSIDRINNDKGYYESNCRWIDSQSQSCNKSTNIDLCVDVASDMLEYLASSKKVSIVSLRKLTSISETTLRRLRDWHWVIKNNKVFGTKKIAGGVSF